MKNQLLILATLTILTLSYSSAQDLMIQPGTEDWKNAYEPDATKPVEIERDNPLRKELFNLARPGMEKKAGKPILFNGSIKGYRNWALFQGSIQGKDGKSINLGEFESNDAVALFLRTANGWVLVDSDAGLTDVFYIIWVEMYGMPGEFVGR